MTQAEAHNILAMGYNVFLTGPAGSGKTYLINSYITHLKSHGVKPAVTASTGIAATHLSGITIHSWSGIGIKDFLSEWDLDNIASNKKTRDRIAETNVLIIDEISMIDANTLDNINMICKHIRNDTRAFGGMQIICIGDFFQLPPISRNNQFRFAFESESWKEAGFITCYLDSQHRARDNELHNILNLMRTHPEERTDDPYYLLITKMEADIGQNFHSTITPTKLFTHNVSVDAYNEKILHELPGRERRNEMLSMGRKNLIESLKKSCLSPEVLRLKVDAQVMFTKNNPEKGYVNGTRGIVVDFNSFDDPIVRLFDDKLITVDRVSFMIEEEGKTLAEIKQYPLRLAWAITIHKSQGLTIEYLEIDLSESFVPGQGYVALSRATHMDGILLKGINPMAVMNDERVLLADEKFRTHSDQAVDRLNSVGKDFVDTKARETIDRFGGTHEKKEIVHEIKAPKISTQLQTLALINEGLSLEEIAKKRAVTLGTIVTHAESLLEEGKVEADKIIHTTKLDKKIQKIIDKIDEINLTPIKIELEKQGIEISYDTLRLYRLHRKK